MPVESVRTSRRKRRPTRLLKTRKLLPNPVPGTCPEESKYPARTEQYQSGDSEETPLNEFKSRISEEFISFPTSTVPVNQVLGHAVV